MKSSLKNGYYLAVYSEIDPILCVMQFSLRHDHNISLFRVNENDVELIHHWEFERMSGLKHHRVAFYDKKDAVEYINGLLAEYDLTISDMQEIIGIPQLSSCDDYHSLEEAPDISYHSVCHLFSSMLIDSDIFQNETIISLSFDGGPDILIAEFAYSKYLYTGAISVKGKVDFFEILSPGSYWQYLKNELQIPEGTLMALAYATSTKLRSIPGYFGDIYKITDCNENFAKLKELIDFLIESKNIDDIYINYDNRFTLKENRISALMKFIQEMSIESVYSCIERIIIKYHLDPKKVYLALSGGYALNCPTNTNIMHRFHFKGQLCCPCVNDGGISIGMALYYFYKKNKRFRFHLNSAFYGSADTNLEYCLKKYSLYIKDVFHGLEYIAEDILSEPIVWFEGRGEIGPRALGHRSLLANPARLDAKEKLNKYKQREWWRPVAPIIIEDELNNWFIDAFPSPFMLNNFFVKKEKENLIKAVLHLDSSARVQTINKKDNPELFNVLNEVRKKTDIPIICNTSLNDKGEPIINSIEEAFNFSLRKGIHIMYINGTRIVLVLHEKYMESKPLKRENNCFIKYSNDLCSLEKFNPFGLSFEELYTYKMNADLHNYDITSYDDVNILRKIIKKLRRSLLLYNIYN